MRILRSRLSAFCIFGAIAPWWVAPGDGWAYINAGFKSEGEYRSYLAGQRRARIAKLGEPFESAIRQFPNDPVPRYQRGLAYLHAREMGHTFGLAAADFDAAVKLDPAFARGYCRRGQAQRLLRRDDPNPAAALADFDKAVELEPGWIPGHLHRAIAYAGIVGRGETEIQIAMESAKKALELAGDSNVSCLLVLSALHGQAGHQDEAERIRKRVIELSPELATSETLKHLDTCLEFARRDPVPRFPVSIYYVVPSQEIDSVKGAEEKSAANR